MKVAQVVALLLGVFLHAALGSHLVGLKGVVVDTDGNGLAATVSLRGVVKATEADGSFAYASLLPCNSVLVVTKDGYYTEKIGVQLSLPGDSLMVLDPVVLRLKSSDVDRMVFGGDVTFGRRYLEDPAFAADPYSGAAAVLDGLRDFFADGSFDFVSVNLETPVLTNPATPHPEKPYYFYTHPDSVQALKDAGVTFAGMGNNHVFDYMEKGIEDTLAYMDGIGLPYTGIGRNSSEAFEPHRFTLQGRLYSMHAATSVNGDRFDESYWYVATPTKGGAADLRDEAGLGAQLAATAGTTRIVQPHFGMEYTYAPSTQGYMEFLAASGADLIVGHHPHVAHGVGVVAGPRGPVPALYSLGNLCFDSDRHETILGTLAVVDFMAARPARVELVPVVIHDYQPELVTGDVANRFIRRQAEFSGPTVLVYPWNFRGRVSFDPAAVPQAVFSVPVRVTIDGSGSGVVDLRGLVDSAASLSAVAFGPELQVQAGRDLMLYGEMEDADADSACDEAEEWYFGASTVVCRTAAYRGRSGLCSSRASRHSAVSILKFRKRVRVWGDATETPLKDLTFFGRLQRQAAGRVTVMARYKASEGDAVFGEEDVVVVPEGSSPADADGALTWETLVAPVHMPADVSTSDPKTANARAVELVVSHYPPSAGSGVARYDDFAIISWEEVLQSGAALRTPHMREFLRVQGPPGEHTIDATFVRYG